MSRYTVWSVLCLCLIQLSLLHLCGAGIISVSREDVQIIGSGYNSTEKTFAIDWFRQNRKIWLGVSDSASKGIAVGQLDRVRKKLNPKELVVSPALKKKLCEKKDFRYFGKSIKFRRQNETSFEVISGCPVSYDTPDYNGFLLFAKFTENAESVEAFDCRRGKLAGFAVDVEASNGQDMAYSERLKVTVQLGAATKALEKTNSDAYFGFAVALSRNLTATSSPRNNLGVGSLHLYKADKSYKETNGTQLGSYFGYSVAIGHVENSSLILAVGSPYWLDVEDWIENVGAVDILSCDTATVIASSDCFRKSSRIKPPRPTRMGRFGSAIATADFNQDGYDDLIVSEPGYEGIGAVHVYLYDPLHRTMSSTPIQTISTPEFYPMPTVFGQSIATKVDVDANGFPDIMTSINGNGSLSLAIFKTRPSVMLEASFSMISSSIYDIDHNRVWNCSNLSFSISGCLALQVCMKYSSKSSGLPHCMVNLQLTVDAGFRVPRVSLVTSSKNTSTRLWQNGTSAITELFNLTNGVQLCAVWYAQSEIVEQLTEVTKGVLMSVQYSANSSTAQTQVDRSTLSPMLINAANFNEYETLQQNLTLKLKNLCGEDQRCNVDLSAIAAFPAGSFVLGKAQMHAVVTVANKLEPAYSARLNIVVPIGFTVSVVNDKQETLRCHPVENETEAERTFGCDIGNPFPGFLDGNLQRNNKSNQTYSVTFGVSDFKVPLRYNKDTVNIAFNVSSETDMSFENDSTDNYAQLLIPLKYQLNLSIEAQSQPNQLLLSAKDEHSTNNVTYIYQMKSLRNAGVQELRLNITSVSSTEKDMALIRSIRFEANGNQLNCSVAALPDIRLNGTNSDTASSDHGKTMELFRHALTSSSKLWPFSAIWNPTVYSSQTELDCKHAKSPAKCVVHACSYRLSSFEDVLILKAVAQLDIQALLAIDTSSIAFFVATRLDARVTDVSYVRENDFPLLMQRIPAEKFAASASFRFPIVLKLEQKDTPVWIIAVASGTAVFVVVIVLALLRYAGFFERKRPRKAATNDAATEQSADDFGKLKSKLDQASAQ